MTDRRIKPVGGGIIRPSLLVVLVLLLAPISGRGETSNLLIIAENEPVIVSGGAPIVRQQTMGSADADNVIARYGGIAFSVNYGGGEAADAMPERVGLPSPMKKSEGLGKLAFKVGFTF